MPRAPFDPYADVNKAQDFAREGVKAYGELLRPDLMRDIGDTIGGLNEIGALRSGGTKVALDDISRNYTDRIGQIASTATLSATGQGLQASGLRLDDRGLNLREDEARNERRSRLLSAIGSVVGAGVGFFTGGPPGAIAGAQAGGSVAGG